MVSPGTALGKSEAFTCACGSEIGVTWGIGNVPTVVWWKPNQPIVVHPVQVVGDW